MAIGDIKQYGTGYLNMPKKWQETLVELIKTPSTSDNELLMVVYLTKWLTALGLDYDIDSVGNIIVSKGSGTRPCVVAHMDTVHLWRKGVEVQESTMFGDKILQAFYYGKQVGTGGDDKNGILAAMYCLEAFENIIVVFFTQEEIGCVGSSGIDECLIEDAGYIIQLDRWGASDFIDVTFNGPTVSKEFDTVADPVKSKFGFRSAEGLITDSINLFEQGIGVSCVNIACGYYKHHTAKEYICLPELWNSILFTETLIKALGNKMYPADSFNDAELDDFYDGRYPVRTFEEELHELSYDVDAKVLDDLFGISKEEFDSYSDSTRREILDQIV